jgi:2-iminobutanoate/2-iminopropanoate deaminase
MPLDIVATTGAPKAIGPYSQAVVTNGFLFSAGQVALDPATGELVTGGIAEQTARALENLGAVLAAANTDFSRVVKTTVFLIDMADFASMNEVYGRVFGSHRPARSTVAVAALPRGARVEIEVIATVRSER